MTYTITRAVKLGIAGVIGVASMALAGPALAQVNDGSSGDGDIFLIVYDQTAGLSYVEDLGVTTSAVASDSKVDSAATAATGGTLSSSLASALNGQSFAADTTLSSYLAAHPTDTYEWQVVANSTVSSNTVATSFLLTTASKPISNTFTDSSGGGMSGAGGTVDTNALNLQGDIDNWTPGLATNGVTARSSALTAFSNSSQYPGNSHDVGALTWYGNGDTIPAITWTPGAGGISSVSNFYLASDAVTNAANPLALAAIFLLGSATMAANGTLSFAASGGAVPIPAAVWLFGSGLLGLVGVARRRLAA